MKNKKILAFFLALFLLFSSQGTDAQEASSNEKSPEEILEILDKFPDGDPPIKDLFENTVVGNADCFDYYEFQSIQVMAELKSGKIKSGEVAKFDVELRNENNYPVVNGYLFARVSKKNENFIEEGNFIVDEFFALQKISIDANAEIEDSFSWSVPENIVKGEYQIDFFFTEGKKFNLSGLSFTNEVIASKTDFTIESENEEGISFVRKNSLVNGEVYSHIGNWPEFKTGNKVIVKQELENTSEKERVIQIKHELYYWDGLDETNKIREKEEKVEISSNSKKAIEFEIPEIQEAIYYLKTTASSEGETSIINTRILGDASKARLNSVILGKFPVKGGDKIPLSACFHSVSQSDFEGKVEVALFDKNGNKIDGWDYSGKIPSQVSANVKEIEFTKNYDYLKVEAKITDRNDKIVDEYSFVYDCSVLKLKECGYAGGAGEISEGGMNKWLFIIVFIPILILLSYIVFQKIRKIKNNKIVLFLFVAFLVLLVVIIFALIDKTKILGQTSSSSQISSKSITTSSKYYHYAGNRIVTSGSVSVNYEARPSVDVSALETGNRFSFIFDYNRPFFNANGGGWDTPYVKWTDDSGDDGNIETNPKYLTRKYMKNTRSYVQKISGGSQGGYIAWVCDKPSIRYSSSNNRIASCSGPNCNANSAGSATITASIGKTTCRLYSLIAYKYPYGSTERMFPQYRGKAPNCTENSGPGCCYDSWDHRAPAFVWGSDEAVWASSLGGIHFYNLTYPGCLTKDKFRTPHSQSSLMTTNTIKNGRYKIDLPARNLSWRVSITTSNRAPSALITSPSSNITVTKNQNIIFTGKGTDPDGDSITAYDWRVGACGTGTYLSNRSSFNYSSFGIGKHLVYFRVRDSKGAWSSCDSRIITVSPSCTPSSPPAGSAFCPGDNKNLTGTVDIPITKVNSLSACTDSRKCEYYIFPINGEVGSAKDQIFCQRPTENLCEKGTPSDVKEGDDGNSWVWTCQGLYGGDDVEGKAVKSCAYQEVNPN